MGGGSDIGGARGGWRFAAAMNGTELQMHALARRLAAVFATLALAGPAAAQEQPVMAVPHPWQMDMQAPGSPVAEKLQALNFGVSVVIVIITMFVGGLLLWVLYRYNHKRNPVPSTISHNSTLEAAWTALPVLILVGIFIPSLRLVYYEDRTHDADMTLKVTAHQWYWSYNYPDSGNVHFDSYMVQDENLKPGQLRHLAVDNQVVVPVGKNIRILVTSTDVIHSFFVPSLGVQRYAIPGRVIETWVRVNKPGDYYGECNQICGMDHSQMPISVHAVSPDDFKSWVDQQKAKNSSASLNGSSRLALASEH
jgi:cytochrome c oxidase subunit II